jgi:hypothetical protein
VVTVTGVTGFAMSIRNYFAIATIFIASNAYSLTADTAKAIAVGEGDPRIEALRAAVTGC